MGTTPSRPTLTQRLRPWPAGRFGNGSTAGHDARAGLVLGVESVPDGLAAGLLAGVNPVYGLYGYLSGTLAGALFTSSAFMTVQATGAMAVLLSDIPQVQDPDTVGPALTTLAVLTGVVMLGLGVAKLGSMTRFVPHAVLVGFVNAVAVNIILGQLDNLTGYTGQGANRVIRSIDTLLHPGQFAWSAVIIGLATLLLIIALERTRMGPIGLVVAVILASVAAAVLKLDGVATITDIATVPDSLPAPTLPDLGLVAALIIPALSLAFVGLVQGAAISGSVPNPDGRYPDASGDFRGQGLANVAAGVFQGMPVGGSMSATNLVRAAGAKTALANLVAGVVMAVSILLFGGLISYIALPALAALLMLVGWRSFKVADVLLVWRTGRTPGTIMAVTFVLTLAIPLQYAVLVGVGLSVILHVAHQSNRVVLRWWIFSEDSPLPVEEDPPARLNSGEVVVLAPYGSLFFASAPVFEAQLPDVPPRCPGGVVVLRLRGTEELGSTFIRAISHYAARLEAAGAALMLAGVGDQVMSQLEATGTMARIRAERVFPAAGRIGDSLSIARAEAARWAAAHGPPTDE